MPGWVYVVFAVFLGLIPAGIASSKGRNFLGWWLFGAFLFPFALVAALLVHIFQQPG